MSKGGSNKVEETPQQRAMADYAMNQLQDYKKRWLPVQNRLAMSIQEAGAADSAARKGAEGRASTDTALQFANAEGALEKSLANRGVGVDSSRGKLAITGMGEDAAKTKGLGATVTDQQVNDAYLRGLTAITAIGRGERAAVESGLADQAAMSAQTARASAEASAIDRAGLASGIGQAAGLGLQQSLGRPNVPGMTIDPNGYGINPTGTQLPTAGGM